MGLYDSVFCHQKLPEIIIEGKIVTFPDSTRWQTQDFECMMDIFHIDIHNRLLRKQSSWEVNCEGHVESHFEGPFEVLNFHGIFDIYNIYKTQENEYWVSFRVKYTDGLLVSINPKVEKITKDK